MHALETNFRLVDRLAEVRLIDKFIRTFFGLPSRCLSRLHRPTQPGHPPVRGCMCSEYRPTGVVLSTAGKETASSA